MHDPRIQHQVTEAGPPNNSGVLNVVATLEQSPMMLKAKLIFGDKFSNDHDHCVSRLTVDKLVNSRLKEAL